MQLKKTANFSAKNQTENLANGDEKNQKVSKRLVSQLKVNTYDYDVDEYGYSKLKSSCNNQKNMKQNQKKKFSSSLIYDSDSLYVSQLMNKKTNQNSINTQNHQHDSTDKIHDEFRVVSSKNMYGLFIFFNFY